MRSKQERRAWDLIVPFAPKGAWVSIRRRLGGAIARAVRNETLWRLLDASLMRCARVIAGHRADLLGERERVRRDALLARAVADVTPGLIVKSGPFRGLRYPRAEAHGSSLFPKLIGSYEAELHGVVERLCRIPFERIVDVGAAEGYYAVGFAKRIPNAEVFAYDTAEAARMMCVAMASLNDVAGRVSVRETCMPDDLVSVCADRRCLVVSDCEGFERELFDGESVPALRSSHVLVEVHDFIHPGVERDLRNRFEATHEIEAVYSLEDEWKARLFDLEVLRTFSEDDRRILLAERRPGVMVWLLMCPRERE